MSKVRPNKNLEFALFGASHHAWRFTASAHERYANRASD
jgi:hypothetical protein